MRHREAARNKRGIPNPGGLPPRVAAP